MNNSRKSAMRDSGVVRFPGSLDPRAQEFRPSNNPNFSPQIPLLAPPPPPHQVFYPPYTPPQLLALVGVGYHQYASSPPSPYVRTVPHLPPESAAPTRTLVLSSVPTEVNESMVRRELEVFGEVRGVQMERACEGILTVHFYDLRHAQKALKTIRDQHMQQQTRLRNLFTALSLNSGAPATLLQPPPPAPGLITGCAVWAQFIIPASTSVPDGHNQGTIVVFNLDPTVSTSCLREIFQAYGEVKELRETPLKKQQRFVEFYDVRDAAKALREMDGKEIEGKQVVIEFSRPGGHGRRFLNGGATIIKSSSPTSNHRAKISMCGHPQPPPSLPLPRRLSSCRTSDIPRACQAPSQSQSYIGPKKTLNWSKGNPNESGNSKNSIEANGGSRISLSVAVGDGVVEKGADGVPQKRTVKNRSQGNINIHNITANSKQQQMIRNRPWKGKQAKKLEARFLINEGAMVESNCSDSRTTVMIKNIPNKYSQKLLLNMLDNHCIHCNEQIGDGDGDDQPLSSYDFVYLPIDFNNKCNVGYGFVNMTSPQATWRLYKAFHHQHWEVFNSRKICEVTYARVQGLEALKEHFKNSKFPCEMDHYLPVAFSPPRDGRQLTEPLPVVGHKHHPQQLLLQPPIMIGLPKTKSNDDDHEMDVADGLKNTKDDVVQENERLLINFSNCSLSQSGGDVGDDDKDSSSGGSI